MSETAIEKAAGQGAMTERACAYCREPIKNPDPVFWCRRPYHLSCVAFAVLRRGLANEADRLEAATHE